jgi:uncharacterized membrane protein YesL
MGGFFSLDGPFYKIGTVIADIMILSLLWLLLSLPVVTSGAATTALFYVTTRRIANKEGYLLRDFFKSFKANFVQSTLVWLTIIGVTLIVVVNILNIGIVPENIRLVVLPVQICILIELFLITTYAFPIIARFEMKYREVFKTAFFMANRHLLTSLLCILCAAALFLISAVCFLGSYPPFYLVAMGIYAYAVSYLFMRVFKKYRPEIDAGDDYVPKEAPRPAADSRPEAYLPPDHDAPKGQ